VSDVPDHDAAPRPLTRPERVLLDAFLAHELPGVGELRAQARATTATRGCTCGCGTIDLHVPVTGARSGRGQRAMTAVRARVSRTRSAGASSTCRPRRPALTSTVPNASALSSTTVGSALRWPSGLIPPRT
jgi:hypothetical protein